MVGLGGRDRVPQRSLELIKHAARKRRAVNTLHAQPQAAVLFPLIQERDDAGPRHRPQGRHLTSQRRAPRRGQAGEPLHRGLPAEQSVLREGHDPEATPTQEPTGDKTCAEALWQSARTHAERLNQA